MFQASQKMVVTFIFGTSPNMLQAPQTRWYFIFGAKFFFRLLHLGRVRWWTRRWQRRWSCKQAVYISIVTCKQAVYKQQCNMQTGSVQLHCNEFRRTKVKHRNWIRNTLKRTRGPSGVPKRVRSAFPRQLSITLPLTDPVVQQHQTPAKFLSACEKVASDRKKIPF
jgi:hypothetical protein